MLRNFLIVLVGFLLAVNLACQSADTTNTNANTSANIPPEFSSSPITTNGNSIPGITDGNSANATKPANGTIPGIPDTSKGNMVVPKGATPTPGIPDEKTLKKQINTPLKDVNVVNNPPKDDKKPNENSANQPKPVRKP
ncbi:MAG: hypothetical protein LC768_15905 [Acidobacteria bacterium]|nr:hypothetical protein [Acidobacteriota bacterium]MCA1639784.1 hypothetical protein [Acidobacteriota bacterium]